MTFLEAAGTGRDPLLNPFPADAARPANAWAFSRGVDGTWAFALEEQKAGTGKGLADLEELRIVFGYLAPGLPPRGDDSRTPDPDLAFLNEVGQPAAVPAADAKAIEEAFFGRDWENSPDARNERLGQLRKALDGTGPLPKANAAPDLAQIVGDELKAVFDGTRVPPFNLKEDPAFLSALLGGVGGSAVVGKPIHVLDPRADPAFGILRPLQVGAGAAGARDLLAKLLDAVKTEYVTPLTAGANALRDVRTRTDHLEQFADALAAQNVRFRELERYATALREIRERVAGTGLSDSERRRLDALLAAEWDALVLRAVAAELRATPTDGNARNAMIHHVLLKIQKERLK